MSADEQTSQPDHGAEPADDRGSEKTEVVDGDAGGLFGALSGGSGLDLGGLLDQALAMQAQLAEAQQEAAETEVVGRSGGGLVQIRVTGAMQFLGVTIDPGAVDPDDVELLADLVLAALHDATAQVAAMTQQAVSGIDLDALGGGLGGMLGGGQ